jgi:hypothetical protein
VIPCILPPQSGKTTGARFRSAPALTLGLKRFMVWHFSPSVSAGAGQEALPRRARSWWMPGCGLRRARAGRVDEDFHLAVVACLSNFSESESFDPRIV